MLREDCGQLRRWLNLELGVGNGPLKRSVEGGLRQMSVPGGAVMVNDAAIAMKCRWKLLLERCSDSDLAMKLSPASYIRRFRRRECYPAGSRTRPSVVINAHWPLNEMQKAEAHAQVNCNVTRGQTSRHWPVN